MSSARFPVLNLKHFARHYHSGIIKPYGPFVWYGMAIPFLHNQMSHSDRSQKSQPSEAESLLSLTSSLKEYDSVIL